MRRHCGDRPVILLVSSNGTGMGHLTRLVAYQRRLPPEVGAHVLSLSQAVPLVARYGVPYEYLPSHEATGLTTGQWRSLFAERIHEVVARVRPAVLVFDGPHPYDGLDAALASSPGTRSVWSRRAMWRAGENTHQLDKESWFDVVLEPGDLAAAADQGATVGRPAHGVRPVTLVDDEGAGDRAASRRALGLPAEGLLGLVALGSGNVNDTDAEVDAAIGALDALGVSACVTQPAIAERLTERDNVHLVRHHPLSEHLGAFDLAISAAGYNSFHENLRFGLPTIFVPNAQMRLDDQVSRAQYADERGWAVSIPTLTGGAATPAVARVLAEGGSMAERARAADPGNGAADAARLIVSLVESAGS